MGSDVVELGTNAPRAAERRAGSAAPLLALLRHPLLGVVARRLAMGLVLLFVVSVLSFVLVSLIPGDAARQILGARATPEAYAKLHHALGLDLPLYEQYWQWARKAVTGDLGVSIYNQQPVTEVIASRLPVTLSLIGGALLVSLLFGVAIGVVSAVRGGVLARILEAATMVGYSLPAFWIGALLIALFAVDLHWLPAAGYVPFADSPTEWLRSLVLPVLALAIGGTASIAKQAREAMLDVLGSEYIRMARASGVPHRRLVMRHALKNAGVRIVTIVSLLGIALLSGTVLVEAVFALPGLGSLAVTASQQHDIPLIVGLVVYFAVIVIVINLVVDLAYTALNPKVRTR